MKRILILTAIAFLCSCGDNRNELMTKLVNEKKVVEDSIGIAGNFEDYYMQHARESRKSTEDTTTWKLFVDTSTYYYVRGHALKQRLKAIDFSIDSLSKMK